MNNIRHFILRSRKVLSLPRNLYQKAYYSRSLPKNHVVEDVFLVSYPKSGNTWLRFLIANALKVYYKIDQDVNFFNILDIIPSIIGDTNLRPEGSFGRADIPRIIKSHSAYNPYYYRVILLVRDPRDVMISHYYYLKDRKQIDDNVKISEFIRSPKYGIERWTEHTKSWYYNNYGSGGGQIIKIFRYEDFLQDTHLQLSSVMDCFGIKMDEKLIDEAIALSSKEKMKDSEQKHRSTNIINAKISFVRKGIASGGQELSDLDREFIANSATNIARILGYDL
jgi:hypothetical protein